MENTKHNDKTQKKNGRRKKRILITGAVCIIAGMVTLSVIMRNREKLPEVEGAPVVGEDFIREVSANGEITSKSSTSVYSTVTAKIKRIPVAVGDLITAGEVLVLLDKASLENSLSSAENALENARMAVRGELLSLRTAYTSSRTNRDQALREYNRTEELHKIGSASNEELQRHKETLELAEENLLSARQKLNFREGRPLNDPRTGSYINDERIINRAPEVKQAEIERDNILESLKDYRIISDIGGIITDLPLEEGGLVTPGTLIAKVQDTKTLEVRANIDEVDLSYLAPGQPVTITSDSFIDKELPGKVAEIAPIIRKIGDSRVCEIGVDILENPGGIARIGASASVFITVETKEGAPAIPVESYFFEENKKKVVLLTPSEGEDPKNPERFIASMREIETGILGIETTEVTAGLEIGDLIMAHRNPAVRDGSEVRLIERSLEEEK